MAILDSHYVHLPDSGVVFGRLLRNLFCHRCVSIPVAVMDAPFWVQVVVWAVCSVMSILLIRPHLVKAIRKGADERKSNSDALKGQIGEVTQTIVAGGYGRVKLDGDDWKAEAPGCREDIAEGARVRVKGHQSIILQVEEY